jgi:Subtilase family
MKFSLTTLARAAALSLLAGSALAGMPQMAPIDLQGQTAALLDTTPTKLSHGLASLRQQHDLARAANPSGAGTNTLPATRLSAANGLQRMGPAWVGESVRVEILASNGNPEPVVKALSALGATAIKNEGAMVYALVPVASLAVLGTHSAVQFVREGGMAVTHSGDVTSQGDAGQRSNQARAQFGVTGKGATVGILSDSFNKLGGAALGVARGELPGPGNPAGYLTPVNVLSDSAPGSTDEGRAMAEIVHDVAPGAALSFYGPVGFADHAAGIRQLVAAGATVVVDDIGWFFEPWYQEGPIAKAAEEAARTRNVTVLTSAANSGNRSVDDFFRPSAVNELRVDGQSVGRWLLHGFEYGSAVTTPVTLSPGSSVALVLQWDEPAASVSVGGRGAGSDLDLFAFTDATGTDLLFASATNNINGDPVEFISVNLPENAAGPATLHLGLGRRFPGAGGFTRGFKIVAFSRGDVQLGSAFAGSTIVGHANSPALVTTCAVRYDAINIAGGPRPEVFSSLGGHRITRKDNGSINFFAQPSAKPDVCAPNGGNNSFFGFDYEGDGKPNFFGTSAAAPHAAGVVALMQSAKNMQLSASATKSILLRSTVDMDDPATPTFDFGFDFKTGFGFLDALTAVTNARNAR